MLITNRSTLKNILIADCKVESDKGNISIDDYIDYLGNKLKPQKMWINDDLYNKNVQDEDFEVDFIANSDIIPKKGGNMEDKKITLQEAKEQVERWKEIIFMHENSYGYYHLSGKQKEDEHNLEFWKDKVKELENAESGTDKAD